MTNAGTQPASAVYLSDVVPAGTDVLAVNGSQGSGAFASGSVRAELGAQNPGARATVDVSLRFREVKEGKAEVVPDVESWCFPCRTHYPHQEVEV